MVGVIVGNQGVKTASQTILGPRGQIGDAAFGSAGKKVFVSADTGLLDITGVDNVLEGRGADATSDLHYFSSSNGGSGWLASFSLLIGSLTGTLNTAGSTVRWKDSEQSLYTYTYDTARACYVNMEGPGAYDTLEYANGQFTRREGTDGRVETYTADGSVWVLRTVRARDENANSTLNVYWNTSPRRVTSIVTASGDSMNLSYDSVGWPTITETYVRDGATINAHSRYYSLDDQGRLAKLVVDLTPEDSSIADGNTQTTSYYYEGTSRRINSMVDSDGSQLDVSYVLVGGGYRVEKTVQTVASGVTRTTYFAYDTVARTTTVTDDAGSQTVLTYDAQSRLTKIVSPPPYSGAAAPTQNFHYTANGDVDWIQDEDNNLTSFAYDAHGNLTRSQDAAGNVIARTYNDRNQVLTETRYLADGSNGTGASATTRYVYDGVWHLRFVVTPEGRVTEHQYNTYGLVSSTLVYTGAQYAGSSFQEADLAGWRSGITDASQIDRTDFTYDPRGNVASVTQFSRNASTAGGDATAPRTITYYTYDQEGRVLKRWSDSENVESFVYDGLGRITHSVDVNGASADYTYSASSQTVTVTLANGATRTTVRDKAGEIVSVTESYTDGTTATGATFSYDNLGRLRRTSDAAGTKSYFLYDADGRKTADIDGAGGVTEYRYDAAGRQIATVRYATAIAVSQLEANGAPANVTIGTVRPAATASDMWSWNIYDAADRLVETIDGEGGCVEFVYDGASRKISQTAYATKLTPAQISGFKSSSPAAKQLPAADSARDGTTRYYYDNDDLLVATLDAGGGLTRFFYDAAGEKVREIGYAKAIPQAQRSASLPQVLAAVQPSAADSRVDYVYDNRGLVRFTIDALGHPVEFGYDGAGRVISTTSYAGTITAPSTYSVASVQAQIGAAGLSGNALNRVSRSVYDVAGRVAYTIDAEGGTVAYAYDSVGNPVRETRYATAFTGVGDQTPGSMASGITSDPAHDRVVRSVYDQAGRLVYQVDGVGYVTERRYDAAGRVTAELSYSTKYTLTDPLTKASVAAALAAASSPISTSYAYDSAGQLLSVTDGAGTVTRYDRDGRGLVIDTKVAFGTTDEAVERRTYDAAGRLASVTAAYGKTEATTTRYGYDARGNLETETDGRLNVTTRTYDAAGRVATIVSPIAAGVAATTSYTYDAFGNVLLAVDPRNNSTFYYYDKVGRLTLEVDPEGFATGTDYTVFGQPQSVTRYANRVASTPTVDTAPTLTLSAQYDATTGFEYDRAGRVVKVRDAENHYEKYTLNAFGERSSVENKRHGITVNSFDKRGLLESETLGVSVKDSAGNVTATSILNTFTYDARGNLESKTEGSSATGGRTTTYEHDGVGRLTKTIHDLVYVFDQETLACASARPTETITYDLRGNVTKTVDGAGAATFYYYDFADRRIAAAVQTDWEKPGSPAKAQLSTWTYDANGNAQSARVYGDLITLPTQAGGAAPAPDPAGASNYRETTYGYDFADRLISSSVAGLTVGEDAAGTYSAQANVTVTTEVTYDKAGNVIRQKDGRGNSVWSFYDKAGRKTAQLDQEKFLTVRDRDAEGNVTTETRYATAVANTPDETTTAATVKSWAVPSAADRTTTFTYDRNGRRKTETRKNVQYSTVGADGVRTGSTGDATIVYAYNEFGEVISKQEATGDLTSYDYDAFGRQIQVISALADANGVHNVVNNYYDAYGNLVGSSENARGTSYTYDKAGRVTSMKDGAGYTHNYGYDGAGRRVLDYGSRQLNDDTSETDARTVRYDAAGRVVSQRAATTGPNGISYGDDSKIAYNAYGDIAGRGVNGLQETFDYDKGGRLWRSTAGDGTVKIFVADRNGATTLTISSSGADLSGDSQASALGRFGAGLSSGAAGAVATVAVLDRRGAQIQERDPFRELGQGQSASTSTFRSYNAFGEVGSETDARGNATTFDYNTLGRVIRKTSPGVSWTDEHGVTTANYAPIEDYYYDASGRLVGTQDANGNLMTRTLLAGSGYGGAPASTLKEFHADGGVFETLYDAFGDARTLINELNQTESRDYDGMHRLITVTHAKRTDTTQLVDHYVYDGLGQRIKHWNSQFGSNVVELTNYDMQGRVTSTVDYMGGVTATTYTRDDTLITQGLGTFGGWTRQTTDPTGHSITEKLDYFGRTTWKSDKGGHQFSYSFDKSGHVATETNTAGASMSFTWLNTGSLGQLTQNGVVASYGYDYDGNRTREINGTHENPSATYDALNRLTHVEDTGEGGAAPMHVDYSYDKNGNVRHTSAVYTPLDGSTTNSQDFWYRYDTMNRVSLAMGSLVGGNIVRDLLGTEIRWNKAGQRDKEVQSFVITRQVPSPTWQGGGQPSMVNESKVVDFARYYDYTADGYLLAETRVPGNFDNATAPTENPRGSWTKVGWNRDALGRVTTYTLGSETMGVSSSTVTSYNLRSEVTYEKNTNVNTVTETYYDYTTAGSGNYSDGQYLGVVTRVRTVSGSTTQTSATDYVWWDAAQRSQLTVTSGANSALTSYSYDTLGHLVSASIGGASQRVEYYSVDPSGQITQRRNGTTVTDNYFYFDGRSIGAVSTTTLRKSFNGGPGSVSADFDRTYQPLGTTQALSSSLYSVQSGDTLRTIAYGLWGDASLWFLIAEANGLTGGETLQAGQQLVIPNKVSSLHKTSETFQVYDPNIAWANTEPTLPGADPIAPAPRHHGGCGVVGQVLLVAIAVAVTVATQGALAGLGPVLSGGIAGAAGSVASQFVGVATGLQDKFSWSGVALGAIGGAVGGALKGVSFISGSGGLVGAANDVIRGALGSALSQGIGVATGLQSKFDWAGVAAAGIGAGVGGQIGGSSFGARFGRGLAMGVADASTRSLLTGSDFGDNLIAALPDIIGATVGEMIGESIGRRLAGSGATPKGTADPDKTADKNAPGSSAGSPPPDVAGQGNAAASYVGAVTSARQAGGQSAALGVATAANALAAAASGEEGIVITAHRHPDWSEAQWAAYAARQARKPGGATLYEGGSAALGLDHGFHVADPSLPVNGPWGPGGAMGYFLTDPDQVARARSGYYVDPASLSFSYYGTSLGSLINQSLLNEDFSVPAPSLGTLLGTWDDGSQNRRLAQTLATNPTPFYITRKRERDIAWIRAPIAPIGDYATVAYLNGWSPQRIEAGGQLNALLGNFVVGPFAEGRGDVRLEPVRSSISLATTRSDSVGYWPPNDGFLGIGLPTQIPAGTLIDRYGLESGRFVSPYGTPLDARSLAPGDPGPYRVYQVIKPIDALGGVASPWFGKPGMGGQWKMSLTVAEARKAHLRQVR